MTAIQRALFAGGRETRIWFAWFVAVVFVFPIPGTIALRNLLLLFGLIALVLTRIGRRPDPVAALRPAALSLLVLTGWIVIQATTLSPWPQLVFSSMRGDWLVPLLVGFTGAWAARQLPPNKALQAVVAALVAHMLWVFGWQVSLLLATGAVGDGSKGIVPFGERDYQSTLNGFLLAMILAERAIAMRMGSRAALFAARLGWAVLAVALVAEVALRTRNGNIVSATLILAASLTLLRSWTRHWRMAMVAISMITVIAASSLLNDPRWRGGIESATLGWHSPELFFKSTNSPELLKLPSGQPVESSAFTRAALASLAIDGIKQHPMGLGIGHDAFGRLVPPQYGHPTMGGSSHSGWLDFALGAGLPGLGLLILAAGLAIRGGWRQFKELNDGTGLLFSFFVGGYLLRCLLDGHLSGWRLGLFAFIVGVMIAGMKNPRTDS